MAEEFDTVTIPQLDNLNIALTSYFATSNLNGKLGKATVADFVAFIAPYIQGVGASGFVPITGTVLPVAPANSFSLIGAQTSTQTTGGNLVTTGLLNLISNGNGTTWSLVKAVDTSAFVNKADLDNVKTAIGSTPVTEKLSLSSNFLTRATNSITDLIWQNNWPLTAKPFDYVNVSFFRLAGTAPILVYLHTGTTFTLLQTITPLDVDALQTIKINTPIPTGSTIAINGNIGYFTGGGVGLKSYNKTTFADVTTGATATFEIPYKVEYVVTANQLNSIPALIDATKTQITGGSAKTINELDTTLTSLSGSLPTGKVYDIQTLAPSLGITAGGTTADTANIWENLWPLPTKQYQYFYLSFIRNAGATPIYVYIHTGTTFTLVSTITPLDVPTLQTVKVNAVVPAGSNVAINGNLAYSTAGVGLRGYNKTTFAVGSTLTFELKYQVDLYNEKTVVVDKKNLSLKNADKVMFIGNSYTEGGWQLRMKHYANSIGMLSDFIPVTYGTGGYNLQQVYDQFTSETALQGWVKPSEMEVGYAVIALLTNNSIAGEDYFNLLSKFCDKLESMGIQPILSSEHHSLNSGIGKYLLALSDFANNRGYTFINWGNFAQSVRASGFDPFMYPPALHVGTRAYWSWVNGLMPYLSQIVVKKSIKLFRQRTGTDFTTLPVFQNNSERAKYFEELEIGNKAHAADKEIYFDRQNQTTLIPSGGTYTGTKNDYGILLNKVAVSFGNYALITVLLDYWDLSSVMVNTVTTGVTNAYLKMYNNTWVEIPFSAQMDLRTYIGKTYGRKVTILLKGSAITISDVNIDYVGVNPVESAKIIKPLKLSNSLLTEVFTGVNWTFGTGVTNYVPVIDPSNAAEFEELPLGITVVKELNVLGEYVTSNFTPSGLGTDQINAQVRILARNFPAFIDTDAKWAASKLNSSSYDLAKIKITVTQGSNSYVSYKYVGLWWNEITVDTLLYGGTAATIRVESADDCNLQLSSVGLYY